VYRSNYPEEINFSFIRAALNYGTNSQFWNRDQRAECLFQTEFRSSSKRGWSRLLLVLSLPMRGRNYSYELYLEVRAHQVRELCVSVLWKTEHEQQPGPAAFDSCHLSSSEIEPKFQRPPQVASRASSGADVSLNFRACRINGCVSL